MDLTSILSWIIIGGIAGAIGNYIVGSNNSLIMDIVWGIVGAVIGGAIIQFITGTGVTGLNLYSIIVAVIGSIIVLSVVKAVGSSSNRDIYKG